MKGYRLDPDRKLTKEEKEMLDKMESTPVSFDEDSPELTAEQLAEFRRIADENRVNRRKQTVTLRLSPRALSKAKALGKGYTSVLSRILEGALEDNEMIQRYL